MASVEKMQRALERAGVNAGTARALQPRAYHSHRSYLLLCSVSIDIGSSVIGRLTIMSYRDKERAHHTGGFSYTVTLARLDEDDAAHTEAVAQSKVRGCMQRAGMAVYATTVGLLAVL
jgi:hypothetical protein